MDDELLVAIGRARLANSTAIGQLIDKGVISPQEARLQTLADGTFTITLPEALPKDAKERVEQNNAPERPGMLGTPVSPSQGGHGEVLPRSQFEKRVDQLAKIDSIHLQRLAQAGLPTLKTNADKAFEELLPDDVGLWAEWQRRIVWGDIIEEIPELTNTALDISKQRIYDAISGDWWHIFSDADDLIDELAEIVLGYHAEDAYVKGLSNTIEIDETKKAPLQKQVSKELAKIDIKSGIVRAVQAGITSHIARQTLDETLKIDDNLINEIRSQLMFLSEKIINDFGKKLIEIMESINE